MEELLESTRRLGGLTIKNKEIKMYKNGYKILLNRSYIDDGLLEPGKKYTIMLIPQTEGD